MIKKENNIIKKSVIITLCISLTIDLLMIYFYLGYLFVVAFPNNVSLSGVCFLWLHFFGSIIATPMAFVGPTILTFAPEEEKWLESIMINSGTINASMIAITLVFVSYLSFGIIVLHKILN